MIHDDKPSLEEALEHHGIKGMRWGVRKSVSAHREALGDARKTKQLNRSSHKGVVTQRKEHASLIEKKKAASKDYAKANQHISSLQKAGKSNTVRFLKYYGAYKLTELVVTGKVTAPFGATKSRGTKFVKNNPGIFDAKVNSSGVYKVTTMK